METILSFFSTLILVTAGLLVMAFWIVLGIVAAIELHDAIDEMLKPSKKEEN